MSDRYTDNGDGTVTDSKTGLMWKREPEPPMTWNEATSATWPTFAGYDDWRLSTVDELLTLVDYSRHDPASSFPGMPSSFFWSASACVGDSGYAWLVGFYGGNAYGGGKNGGYQARLVRAGQSLDSLRAEIEKLREAIKAAWLDGFIDGAHCFDESAKPFKYSDEWWNKSLTKAALDKEKP